MTYKPEHHEPKVRSGRLLGGFYEKRLLDYQIRQWLAVELRSSLSEKRRHRFLPRLVQERQISWKVVGMTQTKQTSVSR